MEQYKIQLLPIGKLVVNPDNPRQIKDENFKRLVKSLEDCPSLFDARPCICSNRTGKNIIMGGNMRYLAAKELKYKKVPTIIMAGLTPEQEREIAIKDNGETFGEWDFDLLANAWDDLPLAEWGVDVPGGWTIDGPEKTKAPLIPEAYGIHIECESESQQLELLEKFDEEGLKCRALIS